MSQRNKIILAVGCFGLIIILFIGSFLHKSNLKNNSTTSTSYALSSISSATQENTESQTPQISEAYISQVTTKIEKTSFTLGDKFTFNDFEVTIGKNIDTMIIDNKYSDNYGKTKIIIPVNLKNVGPETKKFYNWSMHLDCFGSKGTETVDINSIFDETSILSTPEMRPGASVDTNIYLLYDGDGVYGIDFCNYAETKTVEFKISQ